MKLEKTDEKVPYEKCVICETETPYKITEHIDLRHGYIEGCGQLCETCYSHGSDNEMIVIPKSFFRNYPNDSELGSKLRKYYYEKYYRN